MGKAAEIVQYIRDVACKKVFLGVEEATCTVTNNARFGTVLQFAFLVEPGYTLGVAAGFVCLLIPFFSQYVRTCVHLQ